MVTDALHFYRPDVEDERWRYKQEILAQLQDESDKQGEKIDDLEDQLLEAKNEKSETDAAINKIKNGD
jgi:septal ring factor EnvC (AmiA/AmiB activator)